MPTSGLLLRLALVGFLAICAGPGQAQSTATPPASAVPAELRIAAGRRDNNMVIGRYAEALEPARQVLAIQERIADRYSSDVLEALFNLVGIYTRLGRYSEAETLLIRGLEDSERAYGRDHFWTRNAVSDLASLYLSQGRYLEAEPLYRRAMETFERERGRVNVATFGAIRDLARLLQIQGRYDEAEELYQAALSDAERENGPDNARTLEMVRGLAELSVARARYGDAEPLFRRALAGYERLDSDWDRDKAALFAAVGQLYQAQGRYAEAEPFLRRAPDVLERALGPDFPDTIDAISDLGNLYRLWGRATEAEPLLRRSLAGRERVLQPGSPDTLASFEDLLLSWGDPRRTPPDALDIARRFLAGVRDRARQGADQRAQAQREREGLTSATRFALFADIVWNRVSSAPEQREALLPETFGALQESVAGSADRAIAEQAATRYASGRDPSLAALIAERRQLQDEWAALDERLAQRFGDAAGESEAQAPAVRQELERVQARIAAIDAQLEREAPDYLTLIQPRPVGATQARALLAPDEAMLLLVPSRFGTHVMAVTSSGIEWQRSAWNAERIGQAVRRLRWDAGARVSGPAEELAQLHGERADDAPPRFDRNTAHQLYRELIGPVLPRLAGKRRLYVAAGGALAGLPFSLLVSRAPPGADDNPADLRATHWLADDFELVHIPSIRALATLRTQPAPPNGGAPFIGIGDPSLADVTQARSFGATRGLPTAQQVFARGRTRSGTPADVGALRRMPSLPGTQRELRAVQTALGAPNSAVILREQATEPNVRGMTFTGARVVLFSTHGLTSDEASGAGEPGLVLTPPPTPETGDEDYLAIDPANDGYLGASEVTRLRMDADWVILSACNTATGDDDQNLSALARAFLYAGARNLLASHWPVSDDVAPVLIPRTLSLERGGTARSQAFQQAMREIRTGSAHPEWAHPFYWAPFVLIGDGSPSRLRM
ncbi:MAG TPA: CHAT domain-containing protein [Allosphingosinicella sp.]